MTHQSYMANVRFSRVAVWIVRRLPSVLAVALAACSAPLVHPTGPTLQYKEGHVADWHELAHRTADNFKASFSAPQCPVMSDNAHAVFVSPGPPDMPFAAAYRPLLEQELVQRQFAVSETAAGAVVLRFDVQTFLYENNETKLPGGYNTLTTTALALGLQLRQVTSLDTGAGIAAGVGPALDILEALYDTTKAEALVTLTVYDGTRLCYRDSETVYIHTTELPFYWTHLPDFSPQIKSTDITEVELPVHAGGL